MEDSPAVQLIAVEIQNPEFSSLLNDIRDFDWKVVNKLRKEDLTRIQSTGFHFKSKGIENQKQEIKSFLFEHPSVMASDLEMVIYKLNVFARLIALSSNETTQEPEHIEPSRTPIKHEKASKKRSSTSKQKSKKPKRKVIVIEEESSDEQYEEEESSNSADESEDVEYVPVPYKRSRNSHKR